MGYDPRHDPTLRPPDLGFDGLCLIAGVVASAAIWLGAPDQPWQRAVQELSTLLDVLALLLWMGIFAIYWARRRPASLNASHKTQRAGTPRGPRRASQVAIL